MSGGSVLLLTVNTLSAAHSRRSSVSTSVSLPGSPSMSVGPTMRSRGSLPGQGGRGLGGIGGNLGGAEGLLVALSGIRDKGVPEVEVSVRNVASSSIVEPPTRPPTVVFAPLEAHDTLYTPSAICFVPSMGSTWSSPSPAPPSSTPRRPRPVSSIELSGTTSTGAVERVVAHVKRVMNELAGTEIPVIAYTPSQAKLPPQIVDAVKAAGCAEIISAPFTTDSVREVLTKVGPWSVSSAPQALAKPLEPISISKIVPPPPPSKPSLTLSSLPSAPHSASDPNIPFAYTTGEPSAQTLPPTRVAPDAIKPKPSHPDDIDPTRREELIVLLDRWEFEPHKLSDAEVLACAGLLFEAAFETEGMEEEVGIRFDQLPPFLRAVRKIYRTQNQYHNFQHALDVFQAVYWFLCRAGAVPPVQILARADNQDEVQTAGTKEDDSECGKFANSLGPEVNETGVKWRRTRVQGRIRVMRNIDVFALLLAAVGHDVGHPGLSNAFMTNADTPLSRVFDHKSSLEQLHCALLLRLMHKHGMGHLLSSWPTPANHRPGIPKSNGSGLDLGGGLDGTNTNGLGLGIGRIGLVSYASSPGLAATYQTHHFARQPRGFRWLLVQTVLATDMSVHFKWLDAFKTWDASGPSKGAEFRQGIVGLTEDEERLMICQALIKCGDISNPTRPHAVSEHWSKVLLEEWACQANFEQELDLPVTVVNVDVSNGAKQQAQGQVNFIDLFTQPLFNVTASVIPELRPITEQCALNRKLWHERMEKLSEATTPTPTPLSRPRATSQTPEAHYRSIFPLSLPPVLTQSMGQNANQAQTLVGQQIQPATATRPSSSGSASTVGAPSLFSPTGSVSSVSVSGVTGPGPVGAGVESSAVRVAYRASVRKKKSFHRVSWPAPAPAPPPPPLPIPSPLRER
ncbi:3',5'-cyclic-nucleotide phosphodiesterase [Ceratobasidium sp. 370]|nr:3',5'-cyclic-nucleotide phosphodiesterase [Ceratobasidium sp. 370]